MKAVTFNPTTDQFILKELDIPQIADEEVLVKVQACGLNPVDAKIIRWKGMVPSMTDSWVPGLDISGTVLKVGKKVERFKVGDRVLTHGNILLPHGGFAQVSVQHEQSLIAHPNVDAVTAAATPCAGWTAYRALHDKLKAFSHDSILITGGSGGVGGFAIQLAKHFEMKQIITTCSASNTDYVKSLGATHVLDYHKEDIVEKVLEITQNQGVEVGLDTVGFGNDIVVANALGYEGEMVELVDLVKPSSYNSAFLKGLSFHQLSLGSGHRNGQKGLEDMVLAGRTFSSLLEQELIKVPKIKEVSLEEVPEALTLILEQRTVGKIVLNTEL